MIIHELKCVLRENKIIIKVVNKITEVSNGELYMRLT